MKNGHHWTVRGGGIIQGYTLSSLKNPRMLSAEDWKELQRKTRSLTPMFPICWDDFRRASDPVRSAVLGAVMAYLDAEQKPNPKSNILAWGHTGSLAENQRYEKDYREFGTGRAHYFVGTLPTIPLCECSIALGLHGEGYYLDCPADTLATEIDLILEQPDSPPLLLLLSTDLHRTALLLEHGNTSADDLQILARAAGEPIS